MAFAELVRSSALPIFTTDAALAREGSPPNRVNIPILDPEANVTYYCLYRPSGRNDLSGFLRTLSGRSAWTG